MRHKNISSLNKYLAETYYLDSPEPYVYVSFPMSIPLEYLRQIFNRLYDQGIQNVKAWSRDKPYRPIILHNASAVIIVPPVNRFTFKYSYLPSGVRREEDEALKLDIPTWLAYKKLSTDEIEFYTYRRVTNEVDDRLEGFPGTTGSLPLHMSTGLDVYMLDSTEPAGASPEYIWKLMGEEEKSSVSNRNVILLAL